MSAPLILERPTVSLPIGQSTVTTIQLKNGFRMRSFVGASAFLIVGILQISELILHKVGNP
jgi:hypothetical protein